MTVQYYKSYPDALDALKKTLDCRKFKPDEYHIVLTPDRYTLQVENALFKNGGALDLEVLTLSRLCRRVNGNAKILSKEGGVMLAARAVAEVKDELTYYKRAANFPDFAREAYAAILQAAASGVEFDGLKSDGATSAKLHDLSVIKNRYDILKQDSSDPPDRLKDLIARASSDPLIVNTHFYAIGYANATKLNKDVFMRLEKCARSFALFDAEAAQCCKPLTVYRAPDAVSQYKSVASRIRDYVYKGGKYGDVSVVCTEPRTLCRILREYEIDFYADTSDALIDTPPLAMLSALYKLKTSGDARSLVALCKNPFSGCDRRAAEMLQNALAERGAEYGVCERKTGDSCAEKARTRALQILDKFDGDFADACDAVMDYCDFDGIGARLYADGTDAVGPVRSLISLIRKYGAGDFDTDAAAFFSSARAVSVKSLPRRDDRVFVCAPSALRMTRCKALFIVDFNEGVLPVPTKDSGLLSDAELAATGGAIEPSVREQNRRDRMELAAVIANAESVFCSYITAGGGRRSAFLSEYTSNLKEYDHAEEWAALYGSNDASLIARVACTPAAAREVAARGLTSHSAAVAKAAGDRARTAAPFAERVDGAGKKALSVSELTHWFACPYKRFLSDSVGLKERRRGGMSAPDFGLIVHEFMKRFIGSGTLDCSRDAVESMITDILAETGREIDGIERERLVRDACDYANANKNIIEAGNYRPELTEYSFGGNIKLGTCGADFVGVIDRVDVCGNDARIIDYKTGNKKFDFKKCADGSDMQLPMYAAALQGKNVTGMFYMPLRKLYDDNDTRLSGCMVKDESVALDYDGSLMNGEPSSVIAAQLKIDGSGATAFKRPSASLMEEGDFARLIDSAVRVAGVAADEINDGYIERAPSENACEYCAYGGVCVGGRKLRGLPDDETAERGEQ